MTPGATIRDLINAGNENGLKPDTSLYLDNTLTPGGDPALLSGHVSEHVSDSEHVVEHVIPTRDAHVTPTNSPLAKTPRSGDTVLNGGDVLKSHGSSSSVR